MARTQMNGDEEHEVRGEKLVQGDAPGNDYDLESEEMEELLLERAEELAWARNVSVSFRMLEMAAEANYTLEGAAKDKIRE